MIVVLKSLFVLQLLLHFSGPTTLVELLVSGGGIWSWLLSFVYFVLVLVI